MQDLFLYNKEDEEDELGTEAETPAETDDGEEEDFSDFAVNDEE